MMLPKKVTIGAHTYTVEFTDKIDDFGQFDNTKLRILINNSYPQSLQEETFFHECLHAILDLSGHSYDEEEKLVQPVGHMLYELLKENNLLK